jgi:hypothetical protein
MHLKVNIEQNHYMSLISNPVASQQNMKTYFLSQNFSFIAGVVDTGD